MRKGYRKQKNEWEFVARNGDNECWPFSGKINRDGYGVFYYDGRPWMAHRLIYTKLVGPIPRGKILMHSCDTPNCCNPAHLAPATHRENQLDKVKKNRHAKGERSGNAKLTVENVLEVKDYLKTHRHLYGMRFVFAKKFGVCDDAIYKIAAGKNWGHL